MADGSQRSICFVIEALGPGGAERVISLLASRWVEAGWRVSICSFDAPGEPVYHRIDDRVLLVRLGDRAGVARGSRRSLQLLRRLPVLRASLLRERPDLVFSFLTKINVLTLLATIATGLKLVVCERNNALKQKASPMWNRANRFLIRRADGIVAQTARALESIPRSLRGRAMVVPNPILPPLATPAPYDSDRTPLRLVAVGRLTHQKGFDLLIDAFARVARDHPDWMLDIWGEGPDRGALELAIEHLSMVARITLRGVSAEQGGWVEGASAFVLPSRYEGFPNVLGEAMASGLPVVAFDCPYGPRELIRNGHDGMLVEGGNVAALARTLSHVMASPSMRRSIGENARHSATRFTVDRIAQQWEMIIRRIVGKTSATHPAASRAALAFRPWWKG